MGRILTRCEKKGAMIITNIPEKIANHKVHLFLSFDQLKSWAQQPVMIHPRTIGNPVPVTLLACKNVATPHINISTVTKELFVQV